MNSRIAVTGFTLFLTNLLLNFIGIYGASELCIVNSPPYMKFAKNNDDTDVIKTSELTTVLDIVMGFTPQEDSSWNGLRSGTPFHLPKAVTLFVLNGYSDGVDSKCEGLKYPANADSSTKWIFTEVVSHIQDRYPNLSSILMRVSDDDATLPEFMKGGRAEPSKQSSNLNSDSSILKDLTLTSLDVSSASDKVFLAECQQVKEIGAALLPEKKHLQEGQSVDFFVFEMDGMQGLVSAYGPDSPQVREGSQLFSEVMKQYDNTLSKIYDSQHLMLKLTVNNQKPGKVEKTRRTRSLLQNEPESDDGSVKTFQANSTTNIAEFYNEDYPAIFNIIFFTMLLIALSIFAIALGMWHIDPGRDSIIYRMTSQRMKKDN